MISSFYHTDLYFSLWLPCSHFHALWNAGIYLATVCQDGFQTMAPFYVLHPSGFFLIKQGHICSTNYAGVLLLSFSLSLYFSLCLCSFCSFANNLDLYGPVAGCPCADSLPFSPPPPLPLPIFSQGNFALFKFQSTFS